MGNRTRTVLLTTLLFAVALTACANAEEVLAENPGAGDIWKHRAATHWVGRLTHDEYVDRYKRDRRGLYGVAQSFNVDEDATVTAIEVFIGTRAEQTQPVELSLCKDASGKPGTELVSPGATATAKPQMGRGEFTRFTLTPPVKVEAGKTYWIVFSKEDETGVKNPLYDFPCSSKDDEGKRRDWYVAGDVATRGPYAAADKPSPWAVYKGSDTYFKICGEEIK